MQEVYEADNIIMKQGMKPEACETNDICNKGHKKQELCEARGMRDKQYSLSNKSYCICSLPHIRNMRSKRYVTQIIYATRGIPSKMYEKQGVYVKQGLHETKVYCMKQEARYGIRPCSVSLYETKEPTRTQDRGKQLKGRIEKRKTYKENG